MSDLQPIFDTIAAIQRQEAERRLAKHQAAQENRERMRQWSLEFYRMVTELEREGMFGRVVKLEVP